MSEVPQVIHKNKSGRPRNDRGRSGLPFWRIKKLPTRDAVAHLTLEESRARAQDSVNAWLRGLAVPDMGRFTQPFELWRDVIVEGGGGMTAMARSELVSAAKANKYLSAELKRQKYMVLDMRSEIVTELSPVYTTRAPRYQCRVYLKIGPKV